MAHSDQFLTLTQEMRACQICKPYLSAGCRPVFQIDPAARILIAGQAPGKKVHETGIPFSDPSGKRLRQWLGLDSSSFYDASKMAILPMGFCFPGSSKQGDLPPRKECADTWRAQALAQLPRVELTVILGLYARNWHLPQEKKLSLTESVKRWQQHWPHLVVLPHPSPRNIRWFKTNPWFEQDVVPEIRNRVQQFLAIE